MYEALYRKYRPRFFSDVVGQEHITSVLKNQVASGRTSHAYLFAGSRGTGKTTCARILAKAVNCPNAAAHGGDPCGECETCLGIEREEILDVIEMDAASNTGVDYIRELKEESVYAPNACGTRVFIIDEVHMLSTSAFNAFLKLLEEPPEHVMFILATTDVHKLPATIISRCQRYDFRRIPADAIAERLLFIAECEEIDLTEGGAAFIAGLSDGAMRNAVSMLEQASAANPDAEINELTASSSLGVAESPELLTVLKSVGSGDGAEALAALERIYIAGGSMQAFLERLVLAFRDMIVLKATGNAGATSGVSLLGVGYSAPDIAPIAEQFGSARLITCSRTASEAAAAVKTSAAPRADAEIALMRMLAPPETASAQTGQYAGPAAQVGQYSGPQGISQDAEDRIAALERRLSALERSQVRAAPTASAQSEAVPDEREALRKAPVVKAVDKPPLSEGTWRPVPFYAEAEQKLRMTLGILEYTQFRTIKLELDDATDPAKPVVRALCGNSFAYEVLTRPEAARAIGQAIDETGNGSYALRFYPDGEQSPSEAAPRGEDALSALARFGEEQGIGEIVN